jgi:hypothetical protein
MTNLKTLTVNRFRTRTTERQQLTAVTRNCWFFLASASFSRISSILADSTLLAGFTTSRGRETLCAILPKNRRKQNQKIEFMPIEKPSNQTAPVFFQRRITKL